MTHRLGNVVRVAVVIAALLPGAMSSQEESAVELEARALAAPAEPVVFEGFVREPDGRPAVGAVVVSSAGGRALTDESGRFRLEVRVAIDAQSVQVTAVGAATPNCVASNSLTLPATSGPVNAGVLALSRGATCAPSWVPTFGGEPGTNDTVTALAVYDDGSGPALYVGGGFDSAGGVAADGIARWDGSSWSALGSGIAGYVHALAVHDDGGGPALYAGGYFETAGGVVVNNVAKWDGASWSPLENGTRGATGVGVHALVVYDDGLGAALYAGGPFTSAGSVSALRVAKWDGASWSALGSGISGGFTPEVNALAVVDDGSGPVLCAGGKFQSAGGQPANNIAKWDGASWAPLGSGTNDIVRALAVNDDGGGPALFAGGDFSTAGGVGAAYVAKWNGSSWSALAGWTGGRVFALSALDDGAGPALHAGAFSRVARWDGSSWSDVGSGLNHAVYALSEFDDGSGPVLFVGGLMTSAGGVFASHIAKWDGASWSALGGGNSLNGPCWALTGFDDGGGPALYAGGDFTAAGGAAANNIAKWDGTTWTALGSGTNNSVNALAVHDDGGGPALYAGGRFTTAGGVVVNRVAKWNGASWSALGNGVISDVNALVVYDDGGGPRLYAGGIFTNHVVKWNGSSWSAVGGGINGTVFALVNFDDGSGPALFVGGDFQNATTGRNYIAKWNGASWSALGSGMNGQVRVLAAGDIGGGPALYAAGFFTSASGVAANRIAKWNGSSWSPLGSGVNSSLVSSLAVHDDGGGPALYVGGGFTTAGGVAANHIAKWNGSSWSALGSGTADFSVAALTTIDGGNWPALFAGGAFTTPDSGDSYVAQWGCLDLAPALECPSSVHRAEQLGSSPGEIVTFTVTATDDHDPSPVVVCTPPSGSFFPRGTTLVTCTATDAQGNQSSCQFPVVVALKTQEVGGW